MITSETQNQFHIQKWIIIFYLSSLKQSYNIFRTKGNLSNF